MMRLSTFLKLMLALAVALIVAKYGPWLGFSLMQDPEASTVRRAAAIAVVALSFLPWLVVAGWSIAKADEYERHVFLLGIALAAAGSMVAFTAFDFARDTHMIAETEPIPWFPIMIATWALGTLAASMYYRRAR